MGFGFARGKAARAVSKTHSSGWMEARNRKETRTEVRRVEWWVVGSTGFQLESRDSDLGCETDNGRRTPGIG